MTEPRDSSQMAELIRYIARALVDDPDAVDPGIVIRLKAMTFHTNPALF